LEENFAVQQFASMEDTPDFLVKQALQRAEIRFNQNRAEPIDQLLLFKQDPLEIIDQANRNQLLSELEQLQVETLYFKSIRKILELRTSIEQVVLDSLPSGLEDLLALEKQIQEKLSLDFDYWSEVLKAIDYAKCRVIVREMYQQRQEKKPESKIEHKQKFIQEPYDPSMEPAVQSDIMFRDQHVKVQTIEEWDFFLKEHRHKLQQDLSIYGNRKLIHSHANRKKDTSFMKIVTKNLQVDELIMASQELFDEDYKLMEKYSPRKPIYFVRVETGLTFNKSRTETTQVPIGYKFHIFYPDLVDPLIAPTFRLQPIDDKMQMIVFSSGPPYQDIAFHIVNRAWDMSHTKDYVNEFRDNVLNLWFKLIKYN
jgi:hypothetical protein